MKLKGDSLMAPVLERSSVRAARGLLAATLLVTACAGLSLRAKAARARQSSAPTAIVRHGFNVGGSVEGSIRQLAAEDTVLDGEAAVTGDLLVPGTPLVRRDDASTFGGVEQGGGGEQPAGYEISLGVGSRLGRLVTRTDPVALPAVPAPPAAAGTRDVTLDGAGEGVGDFSTVRDLTLNHGVGMVAVPPGTYRALTANGGSGFVLGVAGSTSPAVYNLDTLAVNGGGRLEIVGPVVLTAATAVTLGAPAGAQEHPPWLSLKVASGGVTVNGGGVLYGSVTAPAGAVEINGNALLVGHVACDRLSVNAGGVLRLIQ